jgi:hypothetical protein
MACYDVACSIIEQTGGRSQLTAIGTQPMFKLLKSSPETGYSKRNHQDALMVAI